MVAIAEPRTIVAGKYDESFFIELMLAESFKDLPHTPVHFHHDITKNPRFTLTLEFLGNIQRDMHHRMGYVEKEGFVLILFDEPDRALCKLGGDLLLIPAGNSGINHLVRFDKWQVGPLFKALFHGQVHYSWVVRPHVI